MDVLERIKNQVEAHPLIIYMKGTPQLPQCGFSSKTAEALKSLEIEFAFVNVLADPEIRDGIKSYANWPTIPQLYIKGEFVGGADIVREMYQQGELQKLINSAVG